MSERRALSVAVSMLLACGPAITPTIASAEESVAFQARFTPDKLGASTNLSLEAQLVSSTGGVPAPVRKFTLYAPAGMGIDTRGAGTCTAATLERTGPDGCPGNSRAGFGGGVGVLELPKETIHAPYTLDFFFAPKEHGHLRFLIYARAVAPAGIEFVLTAREVPAPRPYGLGFSVEVPPISTFPGAPNASIESAFVTVGGPHVAYYESVHGKRTLVHLRGLLAPRKCPRGGFPTGGKVDFANGTVFTVNHTIPCPHR